ncbi:MAG: ECF transporter S component [Cellulosilyticaceae bacterium]
MNRQVVRTKTLALVGILGAIIVVMAFTPLGIIPIPGMAATILHIPVIVGALLLGPKIGATLGGIMGMATMVRAIFMPMGPMDLFFRNPIVSIVPRILIGVVAYYAYRGLLRVIKKYYIVLVLTSVIGALTNTVLTMGTLMLVYYKQLGDLTINELGVTVWAFMGIILTTNAIGEMLATAVITPPIVANLRKARKNDHVTSH